jgi:ubiquinone/menaquinone biosynthesis C-methylase UbiE
MVALYDETRVFDQRCFDRALDFLVEQFPPNVFREVFEPGIGTGRIAIPLAERGYRVTGVDISEGMLAILKQRLAQSSRALAVTAQQADVTGVPFSDAAFDMAIAVHLFYFIRNWSKAADEILRVVKHQGPVILMHTGTGTEVPLLNARYKELCAEQGCAISDIGAKSTRDVVDYFERIGCRAEWIRDRWTWTARIRLDKALSYIRARAYSFTTYAPDDIHSAAVERLQSALKDQFGSVDAEVEVQNQIYLVLIRR